MNFRPEQGYETAVQIFQALGMPIQDKNIPQHASQGATGRPLPAQQFRARSSYSATGGGTQIE